MTEAVAFLVQALDVRFGGARHLACVFSSGQTTAQRIITLNPATYREWMRTKKCTIVTVITTGPHTGFCEIERCEQYTDAGGLLSGDRTDRFPDYGFRSFQERLKLVERRRR